MAFRIVVNYKFQGKEKNLSEKKSKFKVWAGGGKYVLNWDFYAMSGST